MGKLIIHYNKKATRHELGNKAMVIGRDKACDLPFPDQRLSRRHARFETTPSGIRLVDLGSRNGTWVNQKKVKEAYLKPEDKIRIGPLRIEIEWEPPPPPPPAPPELPDTATVARPLSEALKEKNQPVSTPSVAAEEVADKTVLLQRKEPQPQQDDASTRILQKAEAASTIPDTRALPADLLRKAAEPTPARAVPSPTPPPSQAAPRPQADRPTGRVATWSWSFKFLLLVTGLGLAVYFFIAWPLMRTLGNEIREESLLRGQALLNLLAATNGPLVGQDRTRELTVDPVTREERVKDAVLLDVDGRVLAPSARADETMETIEGVRLKTQDIRTFYLGRQRGGDYVMVLPLQYQGRRVGVAVLVYEVATAAGGLTLALLFLGFLVLLLGVALTVRLGKRMTLEPIATLRDDVEAVVKGDAEDLPPNQAFEELSDLAESVNRLIDRVPGPGAPVESAHAETAGPVPSAAPSSLVSPEPSTAQLPVGVPESSSPPPTDAASDGVEAAKFWVDENFIVAQVEDPVHDLVGCTRGEMEGKHLIEAIKDQRVLEVVLDTINALADGPSASGKVDSAQCSLAVSATREGTSVVVSLKKL